MLRHKMIHEAVLTVGGKAVLAVVPLVMVAYSILEHEVLKCT